MFRALMLLGGYAMAYTAIDALSTHARRQLTLESAAAAALYVELRLDRLGPLKRGLVERQNFVDEVAEHTGFGCSIFIEDVRVATTASAPNVDGRALGTQAAAEVTEQVLVGGEEFRGVTHTVGQDMLAVVRPLVDADGNRIGMMAVYRDWGRFVADLETFRVVLAGVLGFMFLCTLVFGGGASVRRLKSKLRKNLKKTSRLSAQTEKLGDLAWELEASKVAAERARDEAEQASQAKSVFLANMSHALRTPINAIVGYAEMLNEDALDTPAQVDLGRIESSSHHVLRIISDILDLTKIQSGHGELHRTWFDLRELVEGVTSQVQPVVDANDNELQVRLHPEPHQLFGDENKVSQILVNLLSNAAKFTRRGKIRLRVRIQKNSIEISVKDTGIGLSPEDQERVLGRSVRGDGSSTKRHVGTGLGLTITRHLAELMGGSITLKSKVDVGSTFVVQLPLKSRIGAPEPESKVRPSRVSPTLASW